MGKNIDEFAVDRVRALARKSQNSGPIEDIFFAGTSVPVHKWLHYLPVYDRHFSTIAKDDVRMLEIGVARGGSIDMWRRCFGERATIYGIDIDPECAKLVYPPNQVRIGSQEDPDFLRSVVAEMGAPNIILDDGSHVAPHQAVSFRTLFPLLQAGGVYVIEDLHTAYWPGWIGGIRRPGSGIEMIKGLIDDMHAWYHDEPETWAPRTQVKAIHVYDSIAVIEKADLPPPAHYVSDILKFNV